MRCLVLLIVYSFSTVIFSQTNTRRGTSSAIFFPQGFGIKLLNSSGLSSVDNDISNIGFMNPAAINNFKNYSIGLSYQLSTSIDEAWIADIGFNRIHNLYSQSFGAAAEWNEFTFGLGFGQKYNGNVDIGEIEMTTTQNPDVTGEFFTPTLEKMIHCYSISAAYSFNDLSEIINDLSIGFRYNLNRYDQYDEINELIGEAEDYFHSFDIGLFTNINLDEQRKLGIGLSYETKSEFNAKLEVNSDLLIDPEPIDPNRPPVYVQVDNYVTGSTPAEMKFDLSIDALSQLSFLMNVSSVFWDNGNSNVKDQLEFSTSAVYTFNDDIKTSLGLFLTDYRYKENYFQQLLTELNAFFITAGINYKFQTFYIDLAIADSHLASGDYRKQTIGKLAIGVQF